MMILDSSFNESIIRLGDSTRGLSPLCGPFLLGAAGHQCCAQVRWDTKTPMLVTGIGNVLNIILNYIFSFLEWAGFPPMYMWRVRHWHRQLPGTVEGLTTSSCGLG